MRLMTRSITSAAVMYAMAASNVHAQAAHANFTGTWVLDSSKNVVSGQLGAPTSATSTIVQHGDTVTLDREASTAEMGVIKTHGVFGIDGKPWQNTMPVNGEDVQVTSVLSWDNGSLVIRSTLTFQGTDVEQLDRWTLGADGKTLVTARSVTAMGQEVGSGTLTYVKKP